MWPLQLRSQPHGKITCSQRTNSILYKAGDECDPTCSRGSSLSPHNLGKVWFLWPLKMKLIYNSHHGPVATQDTKNGRPLSLPSKKFEDWWGKQMRILQSSTWLGRSQPWMLGSSWVGTEPRLGGQRNRIYISLNCKCIVFIFLLFVYLFSKMFSLLFY